MNLIPLFGWHIKMRLPMLIGRKFPFQLKPNGFTPAVQEPRQSSFGVTHLMIAIYGIARTRMEQAPGRLVQRRLIHGDYIIWLETLESTCLFVIPQMRFEAVPGHGVQVMLTDGAKQQLILSLVKLIHD